jgi:two-component system response regulator (stage 0 sporulation protein F)
VADLLVVDDDPDLAESLAALLEAEGHEVRTARNGQEGLELVAQRQPDLVLLDVEMPFLTGPEMSYRMFIHDVGQEEIPLVLLSGVTNLLEVAQTVGTPYFLPKPCAFEAIVSLVARGLLERRAPVPEAGRSTRN